LARRRQQVTWLGQVLDPIADKLLISATLVSLVQLDLAPAWMVVVIIGREFAVTGLRSIAYARGLTMPASGLGKLKMASQVVAILLLILGWERLPLLVTLGQVALWVVLGTALVSAVDYFARFQRAMNAMPKVADFTAARAARAAEHKKIS
jgi:CDP-diacylglycerol--glycerol-3-phosphate 3-phosphatidyltransferase